MSRKNLIQLRRGTAAEWTSANPTLASGEGGFETDTKKLKIGDGSTAWNSLSYIGGSGSGDVSTDAIWDAKGDLAVASGSDAADNLAIGTNGFVLTADSAQTLGVKWAAAAGGAPSGSAGGALDGTYPNPGLAASVAGSGLAETSDVLSVNVDGSTIEISTDTLRVKDAGITEAKLGLSDVTTANVTSSAHGLAPKAPADATKFLNGANPPAYAQVKDSDLSTSDITTNDVTTSKHGFVPKAPNDTAKFLRGDGTWANVGAVTSVVSNDVIWDAKGDIAAGTGSDAADNLTVGSNGKVLVSASGETTGLKWETGYLGGLELVYKYTVTGSDKASIDTGVDTPDAGTNDWSNGDVLEIFMMTRTDDAGSAGPTLDITFNNDTGSNYDRQSVTGSNVTASATQANAAASFAITSHGTAGSANVAAVSRMSIPNYNGTTFYKSGEVNTMRGDATAANQRTLVDGFLYRSTSAISRFKVAAQGATKLKVGSQILIYKRRNA